MAGVRTRYEIYTVAIICAMEFEMSAIRYMLDTEHSPIQALGDTNLYISGELWGHYVVLACLPGNQGKGAAAIVTTNVARTFPSIKWRFVVGIGGGVPSGKHDIRLGDVVVSMPDGEHGGVVQYDLGKELEDGFQRKGFLLPPHPTLRSAVGIMKSDHLIKDNKVHEFLSQMMQKSRGLGIYARPSAGSDVLYEPDYLHVSGQLTCAKCNPNKAVVRRPRQSNRPEIHYGLIASGDRVIKSATRRAHVVQALGDVLCFDMEAAGIATEFSCIVIRGVSDYADTHKNDHWQHYAAAAAAACAKELLSYVSLERPSFFDNADLNPPPSWGRSHSRTHPLIAFNGFPPQHQRYYEQQQIENIMKPSERLAATDNYGYIPQREEEYPPRQLSSRQTEYVEDLTVAPLITQSQTQSSMIPREDTDKYIETIDTGDGKRFKCRICEVAFKTTTKARDHIESRCGTIPRHCSQCDMPYRSKESVATHEKRCADPNSNVSARRKLKKSEKAASENIVQ